MPFSMPSLQAAVVCIKGTKHSLNLQPTKAILVGNELLVVPDLKKGTDTKNKDILSINGVKRKSRVTAGADTYDDLLIEELYSKMRWP